MPEAKRPHVKDWPDHPATPEELFERIWQNYRHRAADRPTVRTMMELYAEGMRTLFWKPVELAEIMMALSSRLGHVTHGQTQPEGIVRILNALRDDLTAFARYLNEQANNGE